MAKTGYKIDYVIRNSDESLSDLLSIHQGVFPGNQLSIWSQKKKIIIKVSNTGQVSGDPLSVAKSKIGYVENIENI